MTDWLTWLTHAGDLETGQVPEQGVQSKAVPGEQLVAVDPDVEAQPVGVGLSSPLPCRPVLILLRHTLLVAIVVPGRGAGVKVVVVSSTVC